MYKYQYSSCKNLKKKKGEYNYLFIIIDTKICDCIIIVDYERW